MSDFKMGRLLDRERHRNVLFPVLAKGLSAKPSKKSGDVEERMRLLIRQQDLRAFKVSGSEGTAESRSVHGEGPLGTHK